MIRGAITLAAALGLAACQTMDRPAFTREELSAASPDLRMDFAVPRDRVRYLADFRVAAATPADGTFDLLALSGGGADGAYGAGVLTGWSARGDRPEFEIVTGVSIGALMAPFAFIGEAGDPELAEAFTDGRSDNVLQPRWAMAIFGPGLFRQAPLRRIVDASVDDAMLAAVAAAHRSGRRLYVATTSLDTQGQVIWDMGAVAASGEPDARDRFVDILTASASIPGVFPPILMALERDGRAVRELHADGRTAANFFTLPESMMLEPDLLPPGSPPARLWIAINGRPEARFDVVAFAGVDVAARGLDAMMKASTRMNLTATAQFARLNGMELRLTMAPAEGQENSLDFSRERMERLYKEGQARAISGDAWRPYDGTLAAF